MEKQEKEILIVNVTPYFLEREEVWFEKNSQAIISSIKRQSWWNDKGCVLFEGKKIPLSVLTKTLTDLNYEKVDFVKFKGEFSLRGNVVDVFPINRKEPIRVEFVGNFIGSISNMEVSELEPEEIKKKARILKKLPELKNLKKGSYVVHLDHGIGIFQGIVLEKDEEYFDILYGKAKNSIKHDRLLVPLEKANKLGLYYGFDKPVVNRLSTQTWFKTKKKIKEDLIKLAKQLLELYAKISLIKAPILFEDAYLEKEFRNDFLFEETSDQEKTIFDVLADLQKDVPMDRLVLGDVGFGKTEVALRAAFRAAINKKQVAVLSPTTILAKQHFDNFEKRMSKFGIKVRMLSRLQKPNEVLEIEKDLRDGEVDIVVGTHKLLSKQLKFFDLGLLVVDEEQRFGVKQKERLREKYLSAHLLSLSATPIPRTLHIALSGFKKISNILTPPLNRQNINTYILPYNMEVVKDAILKEIERGGQVFYVHNRIFNIYQEVLKLQKKMPKIKIDFLHGRLSEKEIVRIMDDFKNKKIDVLVATSIIENGLDLENVNTLIVDDATRLGLAQAYQLRGRIGRGHNQSFAYFLHTKELKSLAKQRLEALKEANYLGAGYQIAMKDLELRGSGNILGKEQSGNINKIGLNLYCQMLNETVEQLKN